MKGCFTFECRNEGKLIKSTSRQSEEYEGITLQDAIVDGNALGEVEELDYNYRFEQIGDLVFVVITTDVSKRRGRIVVSDGFISPEIYERLTNMDKQETAEFHKAIRKFKSEMKKASK